MATMCDTGVGPHYDPPARTLALEYTQDGVYNQRTQFYDSVEVTVNTGGGGGGGGDLPTAEDNDVIFIDYDGTIRYSYSADEFAELTAMPENPTHEGLVAQGWNWTLEDAQEYVADYGMLVVGQMYVTESGATEIDIELEEGRTSPYLRFGVTGTAEIDWGDGSAVDTVSGTNKFNPINTQHSYSNVGAYTIKINVTSGTMAMVGDYQKLLLNADSTTLEENVVYAAMVKAVRVGSNVTNIGTRAFYYCGNLEYITLPDSIVDNIGDYAFNDCCTLKAITIPNAMVRANISVLSNCFSMLYASLPNSMKYIDTNLFYEDRALVKATIPTNLTNRGNYMFYNCKALKQVAVPVPPNEVSRDMFYGCFYLQEFDIWDGATAIRTDAFYNCRSIASMTIPASITTIENNAFYGCRGIGELHFKSTTPPTITSNTFFLTPSDCIFYVPSESVEAYKTATNWSTYASQIQGE